MELKSYTVGEVAERLRVNPKTVYRMVRKGTLRGVRIGSLWRIPAETLEEYLTGKKEGK